MGLTTSGGLTLDLIADDGVVRYRLNRDDANGQPLEFKSFDEVIGAMRCAASKFLARHVQLLAEYKARQKLTVGSYVRIRRDSDAYGFLRGMTGYIASFDAQHDRVEVCWEGAYPFSTTLVPGHLDAASHP